MKEEDPFVTCWWEKASGLMFLEMAQFVNVKLNWTENKAQQAWQKLRRLAV